MVCNANKYYITITTITITTTAISTTITIIYYITTINI